MVEEMFKNSTTTTVARVKKLVARFLRQEVEPLLKGRPLVERNPESTGVKKLVARFFRQEVKFPIKGVHSFGRVFKFSTNVIRR